MEVPTSFGLWLRQRRRALDLTQAELARRVGCSVSAIRKIEADERRPSRQVAELLANCLHIPSEDRPIFLKIARAELRVDRLSTNVQTLNVNSPSVHHVPASSAPRLPVPPTPLLGREHELAAIAQLLQNPDCRLLSLIGSGGIGKTRLALAAAAQHQPSFADGVYFVPLAPVSSHKFIIPAMADAIGLAFYGPVEPQTQLLTYLRDTKRQALLVLDNLEHLLHPPAAADQGIDWLEALLQLAPGVKLLTTSRERLNLQGEWVFEIQGLPVPPVEPSADLEHYSAAQLFLQSAQRAQVGFALKPEDGPAVVRLCRLLEGMPLGLELAATWVRLLSCEEIVQEIERNLDFLAVSARDMPERHRSLRAVFNHSWKLLSNEERRVLGQLSVFRGGFEREATQPVTGASLVLLSTLVDKSLIRRTHGGRFDLHELIRQYAAAQLEAEATLEATTPKVFRDIEAHRAHASYYLGLVETAASQLQGPQQLGWIERLEQELDNIRSALEWSLQTRANEHVELVLQLTAALARFWHGHRHSEGRQWLERGLAVEAGLKTRLPASIRAQALTIAGWLACSQQDFERAKTLLHEGLTLFQDAKDTNGLSNALDTLADVAWIEGDYDQAESFYEESLALRRALGMNQRIALSLSSLGHAVVEKGDYIRATALFNESFGLFQALDDIRGLALALYGLGLTAVEQGDHKQALKLLRESLAYFYQLKNKLDSALCVECLARVAVAQGQAERAVQLWSANEALLETLRTSLWANYARRHDHGIAAAQAQLDPATFAAAWAKGRAMTQEQTIAYAMADE